METKQIKEVAMITAIIVENQFDALYPELNIGAMATHDQITEWAIEFERENRHIEDWEEESIKRGVSDWEECVLQFIEQKIGKK